MGLELAGGTTFGDATAQRAWFLGGTRTLRGQPPSAVWGPSFGRGRVEVARTYDVGTLSVFTDAGWATYEGRRHREGADPAGLDPVGPDAGGTGLVGLDPVGAPALEHDGLLFGVGVGASLFDGLMRTDISYGLNGPAREFWIAFYLDSLL